MNSLDSFKYKRRAPCLFQRLVPFALFMIMFPPPGRLFAQPSHRADADYPGIAYVPWGVDEFELFGLTDPEIISKFGKRLHFASDHKSVLLTWGIDACHGYTGPTFKLFYKDKRVYQVQRVFAGCTSTDEGPLLENKRQALRFSIQGLSKIVAGGSASKEEKDKLANAKHELLELDVTAQAPPNLVVPKMPTH